MALPAEFSLLNSELNDFLFAPLDEEENGVPLSMLSALTRLDIDPWAEAARLATMPRDAAVGVLVPLIALFPREHRTSAEVREIAGRLAELLPMRPSWTSPVAAPDADHQRPRWPASPLVWPGLGLVLVVVLVTMALNGWLRWP